MQQTRHDFSFERGTVYRARSRGSGCKEVRRNTTSARMANTHPHTHQRWRASGLTGAAPEAGGRVGGGAVAAEPLGQGRVHQLPPGTPHRNRGRGNLGLQTAAKQRELSPCDGCDTRAHIHKRTSSAKMNRKNDSTQYRHRQKGCRNPQHKGGKERLSWFR